MSPTPSAVAQTGLPSFLPDLLGLLAALVLALVLIAFVGFVYRQLTGGVEWPADQSGDDEVRQGNADDEWDYY